MHGQILNNTMKAENEQSAAMVERPPLQHMMGFSGMPAEAPPPAVYQPPAPAAASPMASKMPQSGRKQNEITKSLQTG